MEGWGLGVMGLSLFRWSAPCLMSMVVLIFVLMSYFYAPYWKVRKVPGPPPAPLLGHLPLLAKYGPDAFRLLAKEYGPIYRFHMGRQPLVIVADPDLCREVGIKKFKDMKNRTSPSPTSGSSLHEKGLFLTRDTRWSSMRNAIIPFYQPTHLARLVPTMQSIIETSTQNLSSGEEINFSHLSLKLAIDVLGKGAFGFDFGLSQPVSSTPHSESTKTDADHDEASGFLKEHIYSTESLKMDLTGSISIILGLVVPILQPLCRWLLARVPGTTDHMMHQTNAKIGRVLDEVVKKRSSQLEQPTCPNFLSAILSAARESPAARALFTRDYVSALAFEHLLAGSATTAFTLSSVIYLVSKHPEVEKKLLEEIDGFGPRDQRPTADDLCKFPYLDQVVKEAMRFYTVSPLVARETSRQVEIGGYTLPKGTWVWMALGVLAKDSRNFPRPEQFRPERFDPAGPEEKLRHPYAHIPFGLGPRMCIGHKFTLQEIKLSLVHLYRHYVFELSPEMEDPPELEYGMVLNFKHGIKVRPIKRYVAIA